MNRRELALLGVAGLAFGGAGSAANAADGLGKTWDGMVEVKSKLLAAVYLTPNASFRGYTQVMVPETEVAFRKHWERDYNDQVSGLDGQVSDADVKAMLAEAATGSTAIFKKTLIAGGYPVVTAPAKNVLRVRTALANIAVEAPDRDDMNISAVGVAAPEAGSATLVVEVRDSVTNALMGRAVDARLAGQNTGGLRNRVTNRADFSELVLTWARLTVKGLDALKTLAPVDASGQPKGSVQKS